MKHLTEQDMLDIVEVNGMKIEDFNWKPPSVQRAAIMQNPWAIQHIYVLSEEMQLLAIRLKHAVFFKIKMPTKSAVDLYNGIVSSNKDMVAEYMKNT